MFRLSKLFRFEASHVLPFHDGKCARLHGHSWTFQLLVEGPTLHETGPQRGMLADFGRLSEVGRSVVERLDHRHLNDVFGLANPTSEVLAKWIFDECLDALPLLAAVVVDETCTSRCEYRP